MTTTKPGEEPENSHGETQPSLPDGAGCGCATIRALKDPATFNPRKRDGRLHWSRETGWRTTNHLDRLKPAKRMRYRVLKAASGLRLILAAGFLKPVSALPNPVA